MNVNSNIPVGVSISISPSASVCAGVPVILEATPLNGGSSPSYQWKVNNINAGTNSSTFTYVPAQGDNVLCVMNSDLACTSGNPAVSGSISITVIPQFTGQRHHFCKSPWPRMRNYERFIFCCCRQWRNSTCLSLECEWSTSRD